MDNFFEDENIVIFYEWIYYQLKNDKRLTFEKKDDTTFLVFAQHKQGMITIWPMGVIEEKIEDNQETVFYLHYQLKSFAFAQDMYHRMIDYLLKEDVVEEKHVLLCCTGGMTTSFFAEKMNKYCELNRLPYCFEASPAYHLDNVYMNYELILLAPQLRYKIMELTPKYHPVVIQSISPVTFATYDCQSLIEQVEAFYKGESNE